MKELMHREDFLEFRNRYQIFNKKYFHILIFKNVNTLWLPYHTINDWHCQLLALPHKGKGKGKTEQREKEKSQSIKWCKTDTILVETLITSYDRQL